MPNTDEWILEWKERNGSYTLRGAFGGQKGEKLEGEVSGWAAAVLLCLGHRDGWALGVIKTIHSVELHDHMQAIGEY